jgi:hypothetical protein
MQDRLTKFNEETGEYEYRERAKTQEEFNAQRKAVVQRLGELEDGLELGELIEKPIELVAPKGKTIQIPKWEYNENG